MENLFGNSTARNLLFYFEEHEQAYVTQLASTLKIPLNMIQKQLEKFERDQILVSSWQQKKKVYSWNEKFVGLVELQKLLKILRKNYVSNINSQEENPADGSSLPIKERLQFAEKLYQQAAQLNPFPYFQPFVKSFTTREEYENWQKKQKNPWLVG